MGWSEDLLMAGLITDEEYQSLKDTGYDIRHNGNTEALQYLFMIAYGYGLDELGDRMFKEYDMSIAFYEELYSGTIVYDDKIERWRDVSTGRFAPDPYEWIRD